MLSQTQEASAEYRQLLIAAKTEQISNFTSDSVPLLEPRLFAFFFDVAL